MILATSRITLIMSRTRKNAARQSTQRIVLEVATNGDGTFAITFNGEVVGSRIPKRWLDDELQSEDKGSGPSACRVEEALVLLEGEQVPP